MPLLNVIRLRFVYKPCMSFFSSFPLLFKTIALSSPSKPLFSPFVALSLHYSLLNKHCSAVPRVFIIIIKAHLMQEVSCVYRSRFVHVTVASLSSVVSICLLNLSCSLLFLSLSSLVAMLHHVFWLSVFVAYSLLHVMLVYPRVGFPCSHRGFSCTRRSYDSRMMTTQCGAFRVVHTTLLRRSYRLPTSVGLAQAHPNNNSVVWPYWQQESFYISYHCGHS